MSEVLEKVYRIDAINRERVDIAAARFSRKLADEANGIPMRVTHYGYRYVARDNGKAEVIKLSD